MSIHEYDTSGPSPAGRLQRAFRLAGEIHGGQVRKGTQIPYLAHLMSVAALVLEHGGDQDAAAAGLLHDAVEDAADGAAAEARIRREFGDRVARIVLGCSDAVAVPGQGKAPWRQRKAAYLDRLADEDDPDVLLVSACDKLHNARATVVDLRAVGPAVWDRFSQPDPAAHLWYYESLGLCYCSRVPAALAGELDRVVAQLRDLAGPDCGLNGSAAARFACAVCGATTGTVRTVAAGTLTDMGSPIGPLRHDRPGVLIDGWLGPAWKALSQTTWMRASGILSSPQPDPGALHAIDWELAPFWCRTCRQCYCLGHWERIVIMDEGFYDYSDGICPQRHRQMIDD